MVRCRCCCFLFRSEEERYHLSTNPIFSSDILFLLVFLFFSVGGGSFLAHRRGFLGVLLGFT